jgi:hypothetical protein
MDRDPELDRLLAPLQAEEPDELTLRRWQRAMAQAQAATPSRRWLGPRAIAAALALMFGAGFAAGSLVTRHAVPTTAHAGAPESNESAGLSATEEHVYAKAD